MFTVRDALELEVLSRARVVAGAAGLGRVVRWVHVVDVPDVAHWVRGGELVLTTAVSLRDDPESRRRLLPDLNEKGLAGLILATGGYLEHAPPEMAEQADELAFPLLELPWDIPFEDVMMAVSERIINAQNSLLRRSAEIHDRLNARVLQGGGFAELAADLSAVLERTVLILDASFAPLSSATPMGAPPLVAHTGEGRLPGELVAYLLESLTPPDHDGAARATRAPARRAVGLLEECVLAPVAVGRQVLGYVLAAGAGEVTDDLDELAVERAATVAALLLYKERAVREAEQRLELSLIDRLLAGATLDGALPASAQRFGLEPAAQYAVALLDPGPHDPATLTSALTSALRAALSRLRQPRLFGERDGTLVCFLHAREGAVTALARRLVVEMAASLSSSMPSGSPRLAVGRCSEIGELALSHQQARETLSVARRLELPGPVVAFDELGLLHWLWALPPAARGENSYAGRVRLLAEYDQAKGAGLLATLEAYLRHAGAVSEAAAALGVHRHTLTYRLDKIEKICEIDLAASLVRLNLQVALLEYRLHG